MVALLTTGAEVQGDLPTETKYWFSTIDGMLEKECFGTLSFERRVPAASELGWQSTLSAPSSNKLL